MEDINRMYDEKAEKKEKEKEEEGECTIEKIKVKTVDTRNLEF